MQRIKPYTPPNRNVFVATFEGRDGKRVTRSLGTDDELTALCVANELRHISWRNLEPGDKLALAFSPIAYRAWFAGERVSIALHPAARDRLSIANDRRLP